MGGCYASHWQTQNKTIIAQEHKQQRGPQTITKEKTVVKIRKEKAVKSGGKYKKQKNGIKIEKKTIQNHPKMCFSKKQNSKIDISIIRATAGEEAGGKQNSIKRKKQLNNTEITNNKLITTKPTHTNNKNKTKQQNRIKNLNTATKALIPPEEQCKPLLSLQEIEPTNKVLDGLLEGLHSLGHFGPQL
eukprot:GCRY01008668.1.p1 GENE.GCRY01008668.1~~GCRY01008668.1.p1  ORF type:complete len:188 (+),score=3.71 GCRY01008668.1:42-605(+)